MRVQIWVNYEKQYEKRAFEQDLMLANYRCVCHRKSFDRTSAQMNEEFN